MIGNLEWTSIDEKTKIIVSLDSDAIPSELNSYELALTGKGLQVLSVSRLFALLLPRVWVYARVSPSQKEFVLSSLRMQKYTTLMCGDGTNDVGALKQAHIGIALLNGNEDDLKKTALKMQVQRQQQLYNQQCQVRLKLNLPILPPPPGLAEYVPLEETSPIEQKMGSPQQQKALVEKQKILAQKQLKEQLAHILGEAAEDVPQIKFGDASVAAPFTSKVSSVLSGNTFSSSLFTSFRLLLSITHSIFLTLLISFLFLFLSNLFLLLIFLS